MRSLAYLGLVNAWRNIGRSLLAVLAMGLAAMLMTGSLTLGEGTTAQRSVEYRSYLGGDVLVYPTWAWPTEADVAALGETGASARLAVLPAHFGSPLSYFHPDFYRTGYLTTGGPGTGYSMFAGPDDLERTLADLRGHPAVVGTVLYRTVPVLTGTLWVEGPSGREPVSLGGFRLRSLPPNLLGDPPPGTPAELDLVDYVTAIPEYVTVAHGAGEHLGDKMFWNTGCYIVEGRPLTTSDGTGGAVEALVNRRAILARERVTTHEVPVSTGQVISLVLPSVARTGEGPEAGLAFDYGRPVTVQLNLVGTYEVASRLHHWIIAKGGSALSGYEQLYLEVPEIMLTEAGFDRVLQVMGLAEGEAPPVGAVVVRLTDLSKSEPVVEDLRKLCPGFSVVSVARETAFANARGLPETIYACPPDKRPVPLPLAQPVVPVDTGDVFGFVVFGFAGLVAAGNSTLMVLSRRSEFAILKAIGLRGFEVGMVVLVEVLVLSTVGLVVGFGAAEVGNLPIILSNQVEPGAVARAVAADFGLVAACTLGCAVTFSLIPVAKTLRITVAEAMRGGS